RSKTWTGKTAAFSIPIVEKLPKGARKPLALILCPTRELALQVAQELEALAAGQDLRVAAIYGGTSMSQQIRALEEGAEVVVGTPGRIYDHIRRRTLDLREARIAVLDEDRKSTRLNSSHVKISYAVFCLKKKKKKR